MNNKFKVDLIVDGQLQKEVYLDINKISDIIKILNSFSLFDRDVVIREFYKDYVIDKCYKGGDDYERD